MSDFKVKTHHIRFPQGLRPRPRWGSLQRSPKPPSCSGLLLRAREGDGKERRRGRGREGRRGDGICRTNVKLLLICHCRILYDHYLPTVIRIVTLIIIGIPSPTHSLTLGLNPSFSANPPYPAFPFSPSGFTIWISHTVYCYF